MNDWSKPVHVFVERRGGTPIDHWSTWLGRVILADSIVEEYRHSATDIEEWLGFEIGHNHVAAVLRCSPNWHAYGYAEKEGPTCQQCESDLRDYTEDPNRGGERPEAFCSWRCARGNMREHDECSLELPEFPGHPNPCTCQTCVITREHEAEYDRACREANH